MGVTGVREVFIVDAVRSPFGSFGGSLRDAVPSDLTATLIEAIVRRTGLDKDLVDEIIIGAHIAVEFGDWPRTAALRAGIPADKPALLVSFNCGSGLQAVIRAAQAVRLGDAEIVLAGGTEIMSAAPYWLRSARWGQRLSHGEMTDAVMGSLKDPIEGLLMGEIAELQADKFGITREEQDEFALTSHNRATEAARLGLLADEIEPATVKVGTRNVLFEKDEGPRADTTLERLSSLKPAFKQGGTVTAGNSSSINDGAALMLIASDHAVSRLGLQPLARIVCYAVTGTEPTMFALAPILATRRILKQMGIGIGDVDLFEINEAFAAQYLIYEKHLELDRSVVNVNGGAIAFGHPVAASGPRILMTLCYELRRRGLRKGVASMCVGGGMGIAILVERAS